MPYAEVAFGAVVAVAAGAVVAVVALVVVGFFAVVFFVAAVTPELESRTRPAAAMAVVLRTRRNRAEFAVIWMGVPLVADVAPWTTRGCRFAEAAGIDVPLEVVRERCSTRTLPAPDAPL